MTPSRPSAGPSRPYHFPATATETLENGVRVIAVPLHNAPITTILASLDAGAEAEEAPQAGLGSLTAAALLEGTHSASADEVAERCELLGGEAESSADWAQATCGLTVPSASFREALMLIRDVMVEPRLPAEGIARLRAERLAEIQQDASDPRTVADESFLSAVFAGESRYGLPLAGAEPQVSLLGAADVAVYYRSRYLPSETVIIIAGDVTATEAFREAGAAWGHWEGARQSFSSPAPKSATQERRLVRVPRPGAPQSELRIGHVSVPRCHEDFHEITVMNAILGGLFSSRINLNLREKHAFTYGASSAFEWRRRGSAFRVSTAVRSDATVAAIREIIGEIERMQEARVQETELSLARDYLCGVFPIRFETTESVADAISVRERFLMSAGYFAEYRDRIAAVDSEAVLRAAQRHLRPSELQVVVVGDPAMSERALERLEMPPADPS